MAEAIEAFSLGNPVMILTRILEKERLIFFGLPPKRLEIMRDFVKTVEGLLFLAIGDEIGEKFGLLASGHTFNSFYSCR